MRAHFRFDNAVVALASLQRVSLPQLISSATTAEACHEEQRGAGSKTRQGREQLEEGSLKVEGLKEHQVATLFGEVRDDGGSYCFIAAICGIIARNNLSIKRDRFRTGRTLIQKTLSWRGCWKVGYEGLHRWLFKAIL